jgi:hypothetical protein
MLKIANPQIAALGIDIGKNTFHVVGHDKSGAILQRTAGPYISDYCSHAPCNRRQN